MKASLNHDTPNISKIIFNREYLFPKSCLNIHKYYRKINVIPVYCYFVTELCNGVKCAPHAYCNNKICICEAGYHGNGQVICESKYLLRFLSLQFCNTIFRNLRILVTKSLFQTNMHTKSIY